MQSYNQNSACDFSGEIVSYIYDEIMSSEKTAFESHLSKCRNCADELAAFSDVHFALEDWREREFAPLSLPEIVIPYHESSVKRGIAAEKQPSWLDGVRQLFGFSNAWQTAGAAFAVLAVCTLAILLALKYPAQTDVAAIPAENQNQSKILQNTETPATTAEIQASNNRIETLNNVKDSEKVSEPPIVKQNNKPILASQKQPNAGQKTPTLKVVAIPVKNDRKLDVKQPSAETLAKNYQNSVKPSHLNGEDEEIKDDSLRLSELFDEDDLQD